MYVNNDKDDGCYKFGFNTGREHVIGLTPFEERIGELVKEIRDPNLTVVDCIYHVKKFFIEESLTIPPAA